MKKENIIILSKKKKEYFIKIGQINLVMVVEKKIALINMEMKAIIQMRIMTIIIIIIIQEIRKKTLIK